MKALGGVGVVRFGALAAAFAGTGCSRANLDAITPTRGIDGGGTVACPSTVLAAGDTAETVAVGSTTRTYLLHVPLAYDGSKPVPLILDFHASFGTGAGERKGSSYPAEVDPEGVIMAFPNGLSGPMGTAWNVGPCCVAADIDDVAFARNLVKQVQTTACIDPKRVYAVGVITGGGMAYYLACRAADVFAAVASSGFDLLAENVADCAPSRAVTEISFRDTADTLVPYDGGLSSFVPGMSVTFLGAQGTFQKWAEIDQCTGLPSGEDSDGCSAYANCNDGVEVMLCTGQGGQNASIAWPVLKRHAR